MILYNMNNHHMNSYSPVDVLVCMLYQLVLVLLPMAVALVCGMTAATGVAAGYVVLLAVGWLGTTHYFHLGSRAGSDRERSKVLASMQWRMMAMVALMLFVAVSIRCSTIGFYFRDYVDRQSLAAWLDGLGLLTDRKATFSLGLTVYLLLAALGHVGGFLLLVFFLDRRFTKRELFTASVALTAFFTALTYLAEPADITLIYILGVLKSVVFAPLPALLWLLVSDVGSAIAERHGSADTGFCLSSTVFVIRVALGVGCIIAGATMAFLGYDAASADMQAWHVVQGIRFMASLFPALLFGIATLAILLFIVSPLTAAQDYGSQYGE